MTQFRRFIGGTNWDDLPELFSVVARFKFIPVAERRAEAPHGLVHRWAGFRRVSPQYCSVALRGPEWEKQIATTPEILMKALNMFEKHGFANSCPTCWASVSILLS